MRTVSSYGAEIRKPNIPLRLTMKTYRQAVSYLTEIYMQVWEELREIPETKKRFNAAEHMVHTTKKNTARFDFDLCFPKMPSYLRRAAIQHALGSISSYETRLEQWTKTGKLSGKPGLSCENHAMPVFYRDVMYREGGEGKDEAYLKLYDGHDWKWFRVCLKHTDMEYLRRNWKGKKASAPTLEKSMKIVEVKHPLVKHKLGLMREQDISTKRFRELASEVGSLLTYEATADLETEKVTIEGWNGPVEIDQIKGKKITVVPILRAGLGH